MKKYKVRVCFKPGRFTKESCFEIEDFKHVAENEKWICIDDGVFTSIKKKSESTHDFSFYSVLDRASLHKNNESFWGTYVELNIYTLKNKRVSTLQKLIKDYIDKEFGVFMNPDLSFMENI